VTYKTNCSQLLHAINYNHKKVYSKSPTGNKVL